MNARAVIEDNRIVDLLAAIAGGVAVSYYDQSAIAFLKTPWSTLDDLKSLVVYVAALVAVALLVFQWNNRFRVKYGWALIAFIGSILCALADASVLSPDDAEAVLTGQSLFPIGVVLYTFITLPVMALVHYLGLMTKRLR